MQTMMAVAAGGALGALSRYLTVGFVSEWLGDKFPWATLAVNALGSFLIGVIYVFVVERLHAVPEFRAMVMVGFLGAFTTFSTFSLETVSLIEQGRGFAAMAYVSSSVVFCALLTAVGIALAKPMFAS